MTNQEILRAGGAYPLRRPGFFVFSEAAFKRAFHVGSLIRYGACGGTGRITAIGKVRFLFKITRFNNTIEERVGTIRAAHGWGKI